MIGSGLAAERTVFSQVLNLWALTGQRLKSGLRLNVAFLKDNQCFIRCDRPWSPLLTCEDKRQSESFLWFWKNPPPTKSHRNNSLCWSGWLRFDGQLTGAWAASRSVLSYERRPDSWLCTKKPSIRTNSELGEGLHYVDEQNTHRASTCSRHLLTHVWLSSTHNCSLNRARSSHSCSENTRVKTASVLMHDSPRSLSGACLYIRALKFGPLSGFFLRWSADDTWLKLLAMMDGPPERDVWAASSVSKSQQALTPTCFSSLLNKKIIIHSEGFKLFWADVIVSPDWIELKMNLIGSEWILNVNLKWTISLFDCFSWVWCDHETMWWTLYNP